MSTRSPLLRLLVRDDTAAQMVEFAVALPLLVVFVVGIFDFSGAYTLKQKLTNVSRDAARTAAGDPANDLLSPSSTIPASVLDAFRLIDNYLIANHINDCGISPSAVTSGLSWSFNSASHGCSVPGLTIVINRGYYVPASGASPPQSTCAPAVSVGSGTPAIVATCVSVRYAYSWRFGRAASLLGFGDSLPSEISGTSVAFNEN